jgi:hypothetical protein
MTGQSEVSSAREAVRELQRAVEGLRRHYRDSVDVARLSIDVGRVAEDLDLLAGPERAPAAGDAAPLEVIDDRDYPAEFWADAGDEGVGRR